MDCNHFQNLPEITTEERRSAQYRMGQIYQKARDERRDLTDSEFGELNLLCNIGSLSYNEREDRSGRLRR